LWMSSTTVEDAVAVSATQGTPEPVRERSLPKICIAS
jgi:hypothetical protein